MPIVHYGVRPPINLLINLAFSSNPVVSPYLQLQLVHYLEDVPLAKTIV